MATKKKATKKNTANKKVAVSKKAPASKKTARKAKAKTAKKSKAAAKTTAVPYITTDKGLKELQHHCEGIMDMIGEYILIQNPKISDKNFKTEAHDIVRMLFGMGQQKSLR
jgi:hypothetical protein